ncbi:metal ABC transporter ATP-binding protein [Microbacterium sp. ZW T5_45]|uniref:metal ABC transporter ATP-binding protein n=1 Tax=Microbacterium sp. ZW T5_45 TaxID=3378080 RepID=UPI003851A904
MNSLSVGTAPSVRLSGIRLAYGEVTVLSGIDLHADPGALTVVVGPNGSGKSSLLEIVAGVRNGWTGRRRVEGAVAFVPQRAAIPATLPVTAGDVVGVGAGARHGMWRRADAESRERVATALARLEISALAGAPFSTLSGGQQQRALLAQGLARGADILLLDEPTTGLDTESSGRIRAVMSEERSRGVALVCVSHDEAVIEDADRVVRLEGGRVVRE